MDNTNLITGPTITNATFSLDSFFHTFFIIVSLGAGFIYIAFSLLMFFRTKNLHSMLKTKQGELLVLLALANVIIAIIISILGFLIAVV